MKTKFRNLEFIFQILNKNKRTKHNYQSNFLDKYPDLFKTMPVLLI